MCGVVAIIGPLAQDRARVQQARDALTSRGPDGAGIWQNSSGLFALAHRRLATNALHDGAQPITNEDNTLAIGVNGEIYGADALRARLVARGHRFRTAVDSEVLLHAWEDDGVACLNAMRGELAFALVDTRRAQLFAARDPYGIKPLVYAHIGNSLVVASEAKALFALGLRPRWNTAALGLALQLQYIAPDQTLFAGVHAVPPGAVLEANTATDGSIAVRVQRWKKHEEAPQLVDVVSARDSLRDALVGAVADRATADVPVAFQLSGGVDSAAIVGIAAQHKPRPACFTVSFSIDEAEGALHSSDAESVAAAESAAFAGANLQEVHVGPLEVCEHLAPAAVAAEGLAINAHLVGKYLMARAVKRAGFSVLLSGEGADELFLGYPHARRDLWRGGDATDRARLAALAQQTGVSAGIMFPDDDPVADTALTAVLGYAPSFLVAKLAMTAPVRALLVPPLRAAANDPSAWRAFAPHSPPLGGEDAMRTANALWTQVVLAGYILRTLADGTEMAFGVEGRVPFLDARVAALAARMPTALKIHDVTEKYILREAVRPFVSARAYGAPKRPFVGPAFASSPAVRAHAARTLAHGSALFDATAVRTFLADVAAAPEAVARRHDPALFMLLTLSALESAYGLAL